MPIDSAGGSARISDTRTFQYKASSNHVPGALYFKSADITVIGVAQAHHREGMQMFPFHFPNETKELNKHLALNFSRRQFIALVITGFVAGCGSILQPATPSSSKPTTTPTSTPTVVLLPAEPIKSENAHGVVQLARLDP